MNPGSPCDWRQASISLAIKTQLGPDQIHEGFSCRIKNEMVKQIYAEYEEAKESLVFTAILGLPFTLKKVLHLELP